MILSRQEINTLMKTVSLTRAEEVDCDGCLEGLAEFAERALEGKTVGEGLEAVEHHLAVCSECCEEYRALHEALQGDG
jgi:hypothetical protein